MSEHVVQSQLDAYNARDAAAFCACYADDVIVTDLDTGVVRLQGIDAFREAYAAQFARWPDQRARVVQRQVAGAFVFDTEYVTGVPDREAAHVVAIYRVKAGKIDRVWFTPRFS
jgi:hypothetical protein